MDILTSDKVEFSLALAIIVFIIGIISIALNGLVVYISSSKNNIKYKIDYQLILLIAIFDIISSLFVLVSQTIEWNSSNPLDFRTSSWCLLSSAIYVPATVAALCLTSQLAIMRYLVIVKSQKISTKLNVAIFTILLCTIFSILVTTSVFQNLKLMPSGLYCIPVNKVTGSAGDIIFGIFGVILVASNFFIIPIAYLFISFHYKKVTESLNVIDKRYLSFSQRYSSILGLVGFSFFYVICLLPELIMIAFESVNSPIINSHGMDSFAFIMFFLVTILNPLFVLTLHSESRSEILSLFMTHYRAFNSRVELK
ncbi:hypothetical protein K502DRAFT_353583 [Neoconidiobolus thromboides FSU 785]|nr:hypothetical protein K502DRAFT_353583 [Neoconidiobolus thromboides FSU 785]